ncbi:hybrid sensor histidine kinase/response regulator [Bacteroides fragilis]|nr:hybrid sensor histidine kinase/response regulator [Bacteroides fragilis]
MKLSLQHRILIGYIILIAVIGSMAAIMFYERNRVQNIESEITEIREANRTINAAHRHITVLATLGEAAITWDEEDYRKYQVRRLRIDSLLQILQRDYEEFVPTKQIDTLRLLLANKEKHLHQAMRVFQQHDSLYQEHLPVLSQQTRSFRTVIRKKKGLAGLFGGKETVQIPTSPNTFHSLNKRLISMEEERQQTINAYTDSLRVQNRELNRKLYVLIQDMDEQTQATFQGKELYLQQSYDRSTMIITGLIVSAIVLLVVSYWIIQRDIREKARTKRELEELIEKLRQSVKKNKELLTARRQTMQTIIHELRSPLSAISGNTELIIADTDETERTRHIQAVRQSVRRMTIMLADLLNFFRLDNGKEQVCPKPFQLQCIANALKHEFTPRTEKKHLAFHIEACETDVVVGDKNMILRIGSNLLSNAVKFTDKGCVSLKTSYSDGVFTLEVSDTGFGIAEAQQKKIFRPFERLTNAATQDGFGLGLPIVCDLVKLMGGKVSLESVVGIGSHFTVRIPLKKAEDEFTGETPASPISRYLRNASVLVLDNDSVQCTMTRDMLARYEIGCDTCRNVGELLNMMRERNYDLLITDLKMPDMNGYEVLELLRSSEIGNSRSIPIVVATALDSSSEEELLANGFNGCLFKPFSATELLETVSRCIENKEQKQEITLSPLLVYGNNEEILERLITETEKEMAELREAHEKRDMTELDNLLHHLRSSWMLINADEPLRELSELIHRSQYDDAVLNERVQAVLNNGERIIRLARETKEGLWAE